METYDAKLLFLPWPRPREAPDGAGKALPATAIACPSGCGVVAKPIAATVKALGAARFDMKYSAGPLGHAKMMRSIELYGSRVMPLVREMLA